MLAIVLLHSLMLLTHLLLLFRQRSPFLRDLLVEIKQALIRRASLSLFCVELNVGWDRAFWDTWVLDLGIRDGLVGVELLVR